MGINGGWGGGGIMGPRGKQLSWKEVGIKESGRGVGLERS